MERRIDDERMEAREWRIKTQTPRANRKKIDPSIATILSKLVAQMFARSHKARSKPMDVGQLEVYLNNDQLIVSDYKVLASC
jgi:hypothetical protein